MEWIQLSLVSDRLTPAGDEDILDIFCHFFVLEMRWIFNNSISMLAFSDNMLLYASAASFFSEFKIASASDVIKSHV